MLHKSPKIIPAQTLQLLETLQSDEMLSGFFLVGGTALALQIGHRQSIDLDLFTIEPFDTASLLTYLSSQYGFQTDKLGINTLIGSISGVKTDFITHTYPLVNPLLEVESLRMASLEDIAAMKLNAISHSGQRLKDFIDVYFLLEIRSLSAMLEAYEVKYPHSNPAIPVKAVAYFGDIDFEANKPMMVKKITIEAMKKRLVAAVQKPYAIF
ncbi:MAG: nucleotidyl transferase AbiEii/AbiGii toxin family protein [Bacteroidetes bacterium]|nr:nucleotidyl transferase AbiEii/AbiGii toxin family protein [Bacteroidota bacterium]